MEHRNKIAQFLESQGYKQQALDVSLDPDHRFELAISLQQLDLASKIAREQNPLDNNKFKALSETALSMGRFDLAEAALQQAQDWEALLLLHSTTGNKVAMEAVAKHSHEHGRFNVAFMASFMLGKVSDCVDLLVAARRIPEAALFARTYAPSRLSGLVKLWKASLIPTNPRAAEALADPLEYDNLFPDIAWVFTCFFYLCLSFLLGSQG